MFISKKELEHMQFCIDDLYESLKNQKLLLKNMESKNKMSPDAPINKLELGFWEEKEYTIKEVVVEILKYLDLSMDTTKPVEESLKLVKKKKPRAKK